MSRFLFLSALGGGMFFAAGCLHPPSMFDKPTLLESSPNRSDITVTGMRVPGPDPGYAAARELKLKVRELAEQLVAEMRDHSLRGTVALPVSFVNLDNFDETSAFGRLVAEQLYFELNQRGYPVREYRLDNSVRIRRREGEFFLSRERGSVAPQSSVVIVGTYSRTPGAVFVNARLVRPKDGRVLRTADMVLEANETVGALLNSGVSRSMPAHSRTAKVASGGGSGTMRIRDFDIAVRPGDPVDITPFDRGEDIH
ncbi:MAG: hypothetical protein LBQ51_03740 [Desulfovibrio sp.]|jgi:hypothetical protein|nr:hypothetical protein [Desulfovibrio sp.]